MRRILLLLIALTVALALPMAGCAQDDADDADTGEETTDDEDATVDDGEEAGDVGPIAVGSKIDTEGQVLSQIILQMLDADGYEVEDQSSLGTTDVNRNALLSGEIDVYPEYTGTAAFQFFPDEDIPVNDAEAMYDMIEELDAENGVTWLGRAPANNTWAVAIPRSLSEEEGITTWEDFAEYVNGGGEVKLVGSQEFIERDDALGAFEEAYGFELGEDQLIALAGGNTAQSEQAAANGTNGANAAMAYGTDGSLAALDLVVLEDTRNAQAIFQPVPTFRSEVIEAAPGIPDVLDPVFAELDLETLQDLNGKVAVEGLAAEDVAEEWLTENGFLE